MSDTGIVDQFPLTGCTEDWQPDEIGHVALFDLSAGKMQRAKELKAEATELEDQAKSIIRPLMSANKAKKFAPTMSSAGGSWSVLGGRPTFNQASAKTALVQAGVDADMVAEAFAGASKVGQPYMRYNAPRARKEN